MSIDRGHAVIAWTTGVTLLASLAPASVVYDAEVDFSIASNPTPGDVWRYGYTEDLDSAFVLYDAPNDTASTDTWRHSVNSDTFGTPSITHNPTDQQQGLRPPRSLDAHPGPDGDYSVLRWTAPGEGLYDIDAFFSGVDNATTDVHVLLNGNSATPLFSGSINGQGDAASFSTGASLALLAGDTLDFAIGYGGNGHFFDSTGIDAVITLIPEPASLSLLGLGGVVMSSRRRV